MIPSVLSDQIKRGVGNYLKTTFQITTHHFNSLMDDFLDEEADHLLKGPYLSMQLPFIKEKMEEDPFQYIELPFPTPYRHQKRSFQRLSIDDPQPTIVATGTGSGKTEAFLLPILDYCASKAGQKGVKAIFIYPMNALANDQAERIAKNIYQNKATHGEVRAGLYIGRGRTGKASEQSTMTADQLITDRDVMQEDPPDILLTNYKMLDYLLMRPRDARIWQYNEPETLRYLVVDELHTFDGAQGTDLACLLRRLKARLKTPESYLCPIGTSATLGGNENTARLSAYAKEVFGEPFTEGAIITEYRVNANRFFSDQDVEYFDIPEPDKEELNPDLFTSPEEYIIKQVALWTGMEFTVSDLQNTGWRIKLGNWLRQHKLFREVMQLIGNHPILVRELLDELQNLYEEFDHNSRRKSYLLLNSYLLLISEAKVQEGDKISPLVDQKQEVWIREMRRMVASVSEDPKLRFAHDLTEDELQGHMPLLVCRDCGHSGWGGVIKEADDHVRTDLDLFYQGYFNDLPDTAFFFPKEGNEEKKPGHQKLCTQCLRVHSMNAEECSACLTDEHLMEVHLYQETKQRKNYNKLVKDCPRCGSHNGLAIIGARSSTLSAVSVSQFFASPYSGDKADKRLLAFSDSVQDASHRSGFFTGRTYRFNLRGAIQQFLDNSSFSGTLAELPGMLSRHYKGQLSSNEEYVAQFIHPDMQWMNDYSYLESYDELPDESDLLELVRKRVEWEVYSEYGHRSLIGRTLEKSGSSTVRIDQDLLEESVRDIATRLREEIGTLREIGDNVVFQLVLGVIYNLRTRGGIYHNMLDSYIQDWGNPYVTRGISYMKNWGHKSRTPSFLTNRQDQNRFQRVLSSSRNTWHHRWAVKVLAQDAPVIEGYVEQVYEILLSRLVTHGLLKKHNVGRNKIWSLHAGHLRIDTEIEDLQCERCGHRLQSTNAELNHWKEAPCIQHHCNGIYQKSGRSDHYYERLYADGHIKRIRSAEHTGLLDREKKEDIEEKFKKQDYPWYPNLLSATPTLEMGIDIGGLNSVFLCSVPPSQANYVQRVGRAGRDSGAALNLTVAEASPHDLYFYSDPLQMVDGDVEPPGCFLNAVAVLLRQYLAFTLDRYIEQYGEETNISNRFGQVVRAYDRKDHEIFPHKFLDYLRKNKQRLFDDFVELFTDEITEDTRKRLWDYIDGSDEISDHLIYRFESLLEYKKEEIDSLRSQRKKINRNIKHREQNPVKPKDYKEIINELKREVAALGSFIVSLEREKTFQALTNEGLIPNYAFPERGIKLKSIIYRKVGDEFKPDEYEYIRPASAGIREFAPDNTFYADGRRIIIDQVNLQLSEPEEWRFCPSCHHTERVSESNSYDKCPLCGDPQWSDGHQTHDVMELKQVMATAFNRDSLSWDENEERDPKFYDKEMLVQINEDDRNIQSAYKLETDRVPFGFEFIRNARLLEINFGEGTSSSDVKKVAGKEVPSVGFEVCSKCGRVAGSNGKINHTRSCSNRDEKDDNVACFYLYRELESEALRILLPSASFEIDSLEHHSFNAAFYLGLKEYFEGDIDHLRTTYMQEKVPGSDFHRHYLVLYDTIPGGTGYLKQLMEDKNNIKEVYEKALEVLRTCKCRTEGESGCYECIYAYRHSFKMANIDSVKAIEILSHIVERWDTLEEVETVKQISSNKYLQSPLEEKFIKLLDQDALNGEKSYLIKDQVNGKDAWRWQWGNRIYRIEPQVNLSDHADIPYNTSADFVIWPMKLPDVKKEYQKPIAIFTDGFQYHKEQLDEDFQKRCGVINETDFLVWNITWSDLIDEDQPSKGFFDINEGRFRALIDKKVAEGKKRVLNRDSDLWMDGNGLKTLLAYLNNPNPDHWNPLANFISLALSDGSLIEQENFDESIEEFIENSDSEHAIWDSNFGGKEGELFTVGTKHAGNPGILKTGLIFTISKENLRPNSDGFKGSRAILKIWDSDQIVQEDKFRKLWEGVLHHLNLLQFLSSVHVFTTRGIESYRYSDWLTESASSSIEEDYVDVLPDLKYLAEELKPFIEAIDAELLSQAEVGYELVGDKNQVLADAELSWENKKVAILGDWQISLKDKFIEKGWEIITIDEAVNKPSNVIEKLNQ